jgi:hypothetical protein
LPIQSSQAILLHGGSQPGGFGDGVGGSQAGPTIAVGQQRPPTGVHPCGQHPIDVISKPIGQFPGGNVVDGFSVVLGVEVVDDGVCVVLLVGSVVGTVVVPVVVLLVPVVEVEVEVEVEVDVVVVVLVVVVGGSIQANSSKIFSGQHLIAPVDGSINI